MINCSQVHAGSANAPFILHSVIAPGRKKLPLPFPTALWELCMEILLGSFSLLHGTHGNIWFGKWDGKG